VIRSGLSASIPRELLTTVVLAAAGTLVTVACALLVAYAGRLSVGRSGRAVAIVASLGYAVPGTVLAIGLLPIVTGADRWLGAMLGAIGATTTGLLLLGSGAAVVYAYLVRFLALGVGGIDAGLARVPPSVDAAARTLGHGAARRLWRVHLPMIRPAVITAALLVFVDCMKELPATLLLRPLGVETLATHLYGEAIRGTYEDGAIAAVLIIAAGLAPVAALARRLR
jgi:iron(III) transport system permease protein